MMDLNFLESIPLAFGDYDIAPLGRTCAIVGNSGNLLDSEYGALIDSHDVVIRFNDAIIDGFEKHVGSKTTCRVVNEHIFNAARENTSMDLERMKRIFSEFDKDFLYTLKNEILIVKTGVNPLLMRDEIDKVEEKNNHVVFVRHEFYGFCNQKINTLSTNGFVAIIMALKYFENTSCFGFSFYQKDVVKHYWEEVAEYDQSCHNFSNEKNFVMRLNDLNYIKVYTGNEGKNG